MSLQILVWCISDYPVIDDTSPAEEIDRLATCENTLDATERQRILTLMPDNPELTIEFSEPGAPGYVSESLTVTLTTNVYNQPIAFTTTGSADVEVISPEATLSGGELVVTGDDPEIPTTVELLITPTTTGTVTIYASATPISAETLTWNQSPGNGAPDEKACQVYATFNHYKMAEIADATELLAIEAPVDVPEVPDVPAEPDDGTSTPDEPGDELVLSGSNTGLMAGIGAALMLTGSALVLHRRKVTQR